MTDSLHEDPDLLKDKTLYKFIWVDSGEVELDIDHQHVVLKKEQLVPLSHLHHLEFLRIEGVTDLASVKYAILETSGQVSVLPYAKFKPASAKAAGVQVEDTNLPVTVISDGQILAENLPKLGKNRAWVDDVLRDYACRAKDVYLLSCEPGGKLYFCRKERG